MGVRGSWLLICLSLVTIQRASERSVSQSKTNEPADVMNLAEYMLYRNTIRSPKGGGLTSPRRNVGNEDGEANDILLRCPEAYVNRGGHQSPPLRMSPRTKEQAI